MDIKELIGETTDYDKKLMLEEKKPKSWCKSVSAFANTLGGALIFGMSNEGVAEGLEDAEDDAEKISEFIKTRITPFPQFRLRFETVDGKKLVVFDVFAGEETPYYYAADGVMEAYTRIGNQSVLVDATEHKRLVLRGKKTSYYVPDRQPVFYSDRSQFIITIPNLNYKNEMIKSILAENDRDQVTGQVIGQVAGQDMGQVIGQVTWRDLAEYCKLPRTRAEMQDFCGLSGRANFRENHLRLLLEKGVVKMTIPDKPNSRNQRYYSE